MHRFLARGKCRVYFLKFQNKQIYIFFIILSKLLNLKLYLNLLLWEFEYLKNAPAAYESVYIFYKFIFGSNIKTLMRIQN